MMLLVILLAGVTVIVLGMVLGPLFRPARAPQARADFDRAVYRDQMKELEREAARGLIAANEAEAARLELSRRLLAADASTGVATTSAGMPVLAAALAVLVAATAAGLYWHLGSPSLPDDPYAARQAERNEVAAAEAQMAQIHAMVAKLAAQMKAHPDDVGGWLRLGRAYAVLGQRDDAAAAFAQAEKLKPNDVNVLLAEAEAYLIGHPLNKKMPNEAVAVFQRIAAIDPAQPAALWYLGIHAAQQGDFATARAKWQKILAGLPANSPDRKTVAAALDAIKNK